MLGCVHGLEQLGKVANLGRWVPHELSALDLLERVATCTSFFTSQRELHFLNSMITEDEMWVINYSSVRKRQWVDEGVRSQAILQADLHPKKVLLSCRWSRIGTEHWELLEKGQTMKAPTYIIQLRKLKDQVDCTRESNAEVQATMTISTSHRKPTEAELEKYG